MEKEIKKRLEKLRKGLEAQKIDGAIIVQKTDLYYFSGTDQDAHLWVPVSGPPLLMVRKSIERAIEDSPFENIVPLSGFSILPDLIEHHSGKAPKNIGLETDIVPASMYLIYKKLFHDAIFTDISPLIRGIRMIKSEYEIDCIKRAVAMADEMYKLVPSFIRDSLTETELAIKIEAFYRGNGHPGIVRTRGFNTECHYGHVFSGKSAAVPSNSPGPTGGEGMGPFFSQGAGQKAILAQEPIMVDYSSSVNGYVADQARIFSVGKLEDHLLFTHDVMLEIQDIISEKAKPGIIAENLYELALEIARKKGIRSGFMGYPDPVPFVAHGIGLELDEWPLIGRKHSTILEEGMVLAMEPKTVFPGKGVVGIENTFVITKYGMKKLNQFPDNIIEC